MRAPSTARLNGSRRHVAVEEGLPASGHLSLVGKEDSTSSISQPTEVFSQPSLGPSRQRHPSDPTTGRPDAEHGRVRARRSSGRDHAANVTGELTTLPTFVLPAGGTSPCAHPPLDSNLRVQTNPASRLAATRRLSSRYAIGGQ